MGPYLFSVSVVCGSDLCTATHRAAWTLVLLLAVVCGL